jgi:uncharacterized membrane protein
MTFGSPLPWWILAALAMAAAGAVYVAYAWAPLSARRVGLLRTLRAAALALIVALLLRPLVFDPPQHTRDALVAVLLDRSRSMAIADADGSARIDRAKALVRDRLIPSLGGEFPIEILGFGDGVAPALLSELEPTANRSDLAGALESAKRRFAGRAVAGFIVISDGGETAGADRDRPATPGAPVFAIGVGDNRAARDREVLSVTAGDASIAGSVVDLTATVVSHGFGAAPMRLTVRENGRPIQVREVAPQADGSAMPVVFRVSPPEAVTEYAVEVDADRSEITAANNVRRTLVGPSRRRRRLLFVQGEPAFEHSFLKRAIDADPAIEVDAVVRKGEDDHGRETFYVQADATRAAGLLDGFPATREGLFAYDGLVVANVEADAFTRDQLAAIADFVDIRGGGLLVLGARSFDRQSWLGTPVEPALPVELTERTGRVVPAASRPSPNHLSLTTEGAEHAIMRMGAGAEDTQRQWSEAPVLAAAADLGDRRPGASILAEITGEDREVHPLIAVQRFGEGRSMVFAGEASWRWKMQRPSGDRFYDTFWRQAARWLTVSAPEPIVIGVPAASTPGDALSISITVRDAAFVPVTDATVALVVTDSGGVEREVPVAADERQPGLYTGRLRTADAGVYHVRAECRRGSTTLGAAEAATLVGGADEELADPRRNDEVLRRVAAATDGALVSEDAETTIRDALLRRAPAPAPATARDLGHTAWALLLAIALLATEWILRRHWGLR